MDCARNIITANFSGGGTSATTAPLWQWDYGQALCITGIEDLPAAFEVHFSTNRTGGVSTVAVGADGQVAIPNVLLTIGKNLNAWIYLSDAQGEGETEYSILIPVKARPMPETYDAEVSGEFDDVVRQVSEYAETAQTAADNAGASASAAAASASEAAASASAADVAKTAAQTAQGKAEDAQAAAESAAQTATEKAQQTAQDAAQAAQSKADAESAAGRAEAAQTGAESAKTDAETAAQGAAASASAASASAASAGQAATSAGQSATAAAGSATTAGNAAQTATTKAGEASASADAAAASETAAQTAQHGAETAETNAGQSASTATTKAAEAAQSASNAADSETAAEAAATRAEQAAASLTVDDALSDTSVNPVQNKVVTGEFAQVKSAIAAAQIVNTASGAIASFSDGADGIPVRGLTVELEPIQAGSGDPSPDNIRPISGRDEVTAWRTGTNVWDEEWEVGNINDNTGEYITGSYVQSKNKIQVVGGLSYYMVKPSTIVYCYFYDANNQYMPQGTAGYLTLSSNVHVFTPPVGAAYIAFVVNTTYGNVYNRDISINYPSTDHDYHAYDGQQVTVQLGQTVYGGTVDVVSGKLTVDFAIKVFNGTENYSDAYFPTIVCTGGGGDLSPIGDYNRRFELVCSHASDVNFASASAQIIQWRFTDTIFGVSNAAEFKAYVAQQYTNGTPVTVAYPIATPLEITLDPATLSTLRGDNNVWSDADSVSVDYVADPKLYIARLTEPDADMIADANIVNGQYFMVGNTLYLATSNIASGAAIVPGVNCTRTNLAAALNAINS